MTRTTRTPARVPLADENGFTLVELLVALAVLGFLSVLLFSGMRFGIRAWDKSYAHVEGADEVRVAQDFLRRTVGNAYPYFSISDPTDPHVEFSGNTDRIELLAPPPTSLGPGGLARYDFSIVRHDGKADLAVAVAPELTADPKASAQEVLLAGLKSVSFSYLGAPAPNAPAGWQAQWQDRKELPELVRIEAGFFDDDARLWPELIIAPQIDVDVSCVLDALTHYCRGRSR
jgi:general secretion pathway protein J